MMKTLIALPLIVFSHLSGAATYNSDGSSGNIQALHDAAANGDTITVPAGTFTWTTPVVITKAITLKGVRSGVPKQSQHNHLITWQNPPPGLEVACTDPVIVTTATTIGNPSTAVIHGAGTNTLLTITELPNAKATIRGIRFTAPTGSPLMLWTSSGQEPALPDCWFTITSG